MASPSPTFDTPGADREAQFLREFSRARCRRESTFGIRLPPSVHDDLITGELFWMTWMYVDLGTNNKNLNWDTLGPSELASIVATTIRRIRKMDSARFRRGDDGPLEPRRIFDKLVATADSIIKKRLAHLAKSPSDALAPPAWTVETAELQGRRSSMEDRFIAVPDVQRCFCDSLNENDSADQIGFFAVFDGHNGSGAARFAQAHLLPTIVGQKNFYSDPVGSLRAAFRAVDQSFGSLREAGGTTCVSVMLFKDKMLVAWVGDSLAVLSRRGKCVYLLDPHKPDRPDEKARIEAAGGNVSQVYDVWRVNHVIAVSRAIGDHAMKDFVIAEPDVAEVALTGEEDFVVLACDGLWDVLSPNQVVAFVHEFDANPTPDRSSVALALAQRAIDLGSNDNVTCLVVRFNRKRATSL